MTDRWARLEQIYHEAADLPATERDAFLSVACGDDPDLRHDVDALLRHADTVFLESAEPASLTGSRISVYEVREVIGRGGMGVVYHAVDTKLGRDVAIKVLPSAWLVDSARRTRFEREARILASLNHPNIAAVFELETSSGCPALVMELVDGETLRERIAAERIRPSEAITLGEQMAAGLEAAHEAGVVHRDFKPENVKITPAGLVKILDFGIATAQTRRWPELTAGVTREGDVLGTASYMSPEQARGKAVDRRTDIWALGCVLFEMVTRSRAFAGNALLYAVDADVDCEPDWNLLERFAPPGLTRLIRRCLAKNPSERLRDAGDARLELRALAYRAGPGGHSTRRFSVVAHRCYGVCRSHGLRPRHHASRTGPAGNIDRPRVSSAIKREPSARWRAIRRRTRWTPGCVCRTQRGGHYTVVHPVSRRSQRASRSEL